MSGLAIICCTTPPVLVTDQKADRSIYLAIGYKEMVKVKNKNLKFGFYLMVSIDKYFKVNKQTKRAHHIFCQIFV